MADDHELRRRKARAETAKRILDDELVQEAFETIEGAVFKMWRDSPSDEPEARERLYFLQEATGMFKEFFREALVKGQNADVELLMRSKANQSPKE